MLDIELIRRIQNGGKILLVGAHSDDIEIGCGATVAKIIDGATDISVTWVVLNATGQREQEASESAKRMLENIPNSNVVLKNFRNGFFPYVAHEIKDFFESLKTFPEPDLILTHYGNDRHQDHRLVSELTWNTFRNHMILEYEIPKYDGDLGAPNMFVSLSADQVDAKTQHIEEFFQSQADKQWFCADTLKGVARIRGFECNASEGFAEAFYCRKAMLG